VGISHTYLPIHGDISFNMETCDQVTLILRKMQDQISLTPTWRSFSGCGREREKACFAHQSG